MFKRILFLFLSFFLILSSFAFIASADGETSPDETDPLITETVSDVSDVPSSVPETTAAPTIQIIDRASETDSSSYYIVFCLSALLGLFLAQAFSFWKW